MSFSQLKSLVDSPKTIKESNNDLYVNHYTCIIHEKGYLNNKNDYRFWKCVEGKYTIPADLTKGLIVDNSVSVCKYIPKRWQKSILERRGFDSYMVYSDEDIKKSVHEN